MNNKIYKKRVKKIKKGIFFLALLNTYLFLLGSVFFFMEYKHYLLTISSVTAFVIFLKFLFIWQNKNKEIKDLKRKVKR